MSSKLTNKQTRGEAGLLHFGPPISKIKNGLLHNSWANVDNISQPCKLLGMIYDLLQSIKGRPLEIILIIIYKSVWELIRIHSEL